MLIEHV